MMKWKHGHPSSSQPSQIDFMSWLAILHSNSLVFWAYFLGQRSFLDSMSFPFLFPIWLLTSLKDTPRMLIILKLFRFSFGVLHHFQNIEMLCPTAPQRLSFLDY